MTIQFDEVLVNLEPFIKKASETGELPIDIGSGYTYKQRGDALVELAHYFIKFTAERQHNLRCLLIQNASLGVTIVFNDKALSIAYTRQKDELFDKVVGEYVAMSRFSEGKVILMPPNCNRLRFAMSILKSMYP